MVYLIGFLVIFNVFGANEALYRQILKPKATGINKELAQVPKVIARSDLYELDVNADGVKEFIQVEKRDGIDFFFLKGIRKNTLFKMKLLGMGGQSYLYKVRLLRISKSTNLLVLYFDEGFVQAYNYAKTARLYFVTIDNNNLKTIFGFKGPHTFLEEQTPHNSYINRKYMVSAYDFNKDGYNEISVKYKNTNRVFSYLGRGEWLRF